MFSKSCEYAIKAVIFLAAGSADDTLYSIGAISKAIDAPNAYSAKILQKLAGKKIISSVKGSSGGYFIEKNKLNKIYLSSIVDAFDGDKIYTACGLGLKQCSTTNPCPLHEQFKKIRTDLKLMLEKTTIKSLVDELSVRGSLVKLK